MKSILPPCPLIREVKINQLSSAGAAFSDNNFVTESMTQQYPWMERYPWYCVIKDCEIIKAPIKEGIPMDFIWDALGSDTYMASFGRNEAFQSVSIKHHQKAHMRLSGNAKQFIDKKLDDLKGKYGVTTYQSS